jgi:hypothetical protein
MIPLMAELSSECVPPVVIGGVGGGGTRVVSQILNGLGFDLGPVSVPTLDSVLFTTLFTLPALARAPGDFAELDAFFLGRKEWWEIFVNAITRKGLAAAQLEKVKQLAEETLIPRISASSRLEETGKTDLIGRVRDALGHCRSVGHTVTAVDAPWGWKEPNTSVFLSQIVRRFPAMKYIHVIRHGLDMAYAGNVNQTKNWGHLFGINSNEIADPNSCLEYWVRSNERTITYAEAMLKGNFAVISFDDLVLTPNVAISNLCKFLNVNVDERKLQALCEIPVVPSSLARYKEYNLSKLDRRLIEKVREFGFNIH